MGWLPGMRPISLVAAAMLVSTTAAATVSISIGSTSGAPGDTVPFQVTLASGGASVGGVQNLILFDPATPIASCAIFPPLAGLSGWSLRPQGCTPLVNCTQANFVILLFGTAIPDGLLYQCTVKIRADAPGGVFPLRCSGAGAGEPGGQVLAVQCVDGQVNVLRPTPTPTRTPTPTGTPTRAASLSPTPTVMLAATPTPVANQCSGDCDGDRQVTVDEILTMVNIALGNGSNAECKPGDANRDGKVTVDEIVIAVRAALNGCVAG
jgi:hypothetical protein